MVSRAEDGRNVIIRVVLADDHALVRAGLRSLVADMPGVKVVGEASNGHEALQLVKECRPHVVLMDITMPGMNGLEATTRIMASHPETSVVILSMHASETYALHALRAGAAGYILKDGEPSELDRAIRAAARGEPYLTSQVSKHLITEYRRRAADLPAPPQERLTARQREILQLVAEGQSTKQIAARLGLSAKTIENHRAGLMKRLAIHDIAGLVRFAVSSGLIDPQP